MPMGYDLPTPKARQTGLRLPRPRATEKLMLMGSVRSMLTEKLRQKQMERQRPKQTASPMAMPMGWDLSRPKAKARLMRLDSG